MTTTTPKFLINTVFSLFQIFPFYATSVCDIGRLGLHVRERKLSVEIYREYSNFIHWNFVDLNKNFDVMHSGHVIIGTSSTFHLFLQP